jgi:hypothetical protein
MFDIDETIDAFRRGVLDFDCKRMVLLQRKEGGSVSRAKAISANRQTAHSY